MKATDLCVPIYLNQKIVFDVLAMLEDGFSQLSTVTTSASESEATRSGYGGSVGASNVFAFLGVSLKAERGKDKGVQGQQEATVEKVHTPTSLFFKLRSLLDQESLIERVTKIDDVKQLESGQFVEFKAVLRKNPLFDYVDTFKQILEIADLAPEQENTAQKLGGNSGRKGNKSKSPQPKEPKSQDTPIYQQMDILRTALTQFDSLEMIGEMLDASPARSVLSTNLEYFNDKDASEIIDGEFRVLGKVVRVIHPNSGSTINLLRKTAFGRFNSELFDELSDALSDAGDAGIELPDFITEIEGPAIQVMPVAIFVYNFCLESYPDAGKVKF